MRMFGGTSGKDQIQWRIARWVLWRFIQNAAQPVLLDRSPRNKTGHETRWLQSDINSFLSEVAPEVALYPALNTFGRGFGLRHVLGCEGAPGDQRDR